MGMITIETPIAENFSYIIKDAEQTASLVEKLDKTVTKIKIVAGRKVKFQPATADRKETLEAAFGIWSDRQESGGKSPAKSEKKIENQLSGISSRHK